MKIPGRLTPHTVTVKRWAGTGSMGDVYGPSAELRRVYVEEKTKLIRAKDGTDVTANAQVFIRPEHAPVPTDSEITLPSGRVGVVVGVEHYHMPPAPEYYVLLVV